MLSQQQLREIGAKACVDPRTVKAILEDPRRCARSHSTTRARVDQVAREFGIQPVAEARFQ